MIEKVAFFAYRFVRTLQYLGLQDSRSGLGCISNLRQEPKEEEEGGWTRNNATRLPPPLRYYATEEEAMITAVLMNRLDSDRIPSMLHTSSVP